MKKFKQLISRKKGLVVPQDDSHQETITKEYSNKEEFEDFGIESERVKIQDFREDEWFEEVEKVDHH